MLLQVTTIAGTPGTPGTTPSPTSALQAYFSSPTAVSALCPYFGQKNCRLDFYNVIFIAKRELSTCSSTAHTSSLLAGQHTFAHNQKFSLMQTDARMLQVWYPCDTQVVVTSQGQLLVSDTGNQAIMSVQNSMVSRFAGAQCGRLLCMSESCCAMQSPPGSDL